MRARSRFVTLRPIVDLGSLPPPADFIADTRIEAAGDGRYCCDLSGRWNAAVYPFGGVAVAIALRAAQAELALPQQRLRTATTVFVSPVPEGKLEIDVARLRTGRQMSQLQVSARAAGSDDGGLTLLAAYGSEREGFTFVDSEPPAADEPDRYGPPPDPPEGFPRFRATFFEQIDTRPVRMNPPWKTDWTAGRAEAVRWMRYRSAPRLADGTLDPLALVALSDTMPPAIMQKLGPGNRPFFAPSCDLTVHCFGTTSEDWLLVRSRCRQAGEGYASASGEIWSRDRRLLVYATQVMLLRFEIPTA
jgi:acyl-CoA thioesterase II